jgi:hypothetical protein
MRLAALTLISSLALAGVTASANAAPAIPNLAAPTNLVQVSGGCGPAYHPNPWGYCVPNHYAYGYGYGYGGGYGPHYGWGYYHPHWHYWHW